MSKINWQVRLKSPQFWIGIISAVAVFAISIAAVFGFDLKDDINSMAEAISSAIVALFSIGAAIGVVTDPTTQGIVDSVQALTYTEPKPQGVGAGSEVEHVVTEETVYSDNKE